MTLREMYSSYSLLQRISKRKQISKTGGFDCKKEPEDCGAQCSGSFLQFIFNTYLYMRVIVQIEQGRGRKIKRLIEDPLTGSEILRWLPEDKR